MWETLNRYLGRLDTTDDGEEENSDHGSDEDADNGSSDSSDSELDMEQDSNSVRSSDSGDISDTVRDGDKDIANSQEKHIRHDAIEVPANHCPFETEEHMHVFVGALNEMREQGIIPTGFDVAEVEWDEDGYPDAEYIKIGRRHIQVHLPHDIWWPRAVQWVQGLFVLSKLLLEYELE